MRCFSFHPPMELRSRAEIYCLHFVKWIYAVLLNFPFISFFPLLGFTQPSANKQNTQRFYISFLVVRHKARRTTTAHIRGERKMGENENVMVNGENLFYILKISLWLSHPRRFCVVLCLRMHVWQRKSSSQMLHEHKRVRLMWKLLLMFNVWQRFLFLSHGTVQWIINEEFWLFSLVPRRGELRRWCSTIWAT